MGLISMISLFACTPLEPRKIPLGSTLLASSGIIGYWAFDETTLGTAPGGTDFEDSSGKGHHAVANGTLTLGITGIRNTGIRSTGLGSVSIPIDLSQEKVVTISLWVWEHITASNLSNILFEYTPNSNAANGFFSSLDDSSATPIHSFVNRIHGASGTFGNTSPTLSTGWHNVMATYDQTNVSQNSITLSVDGALVSTTQIATETANNAGTFANSNLYLLCRGGTSLCLSADIDELIIWNRAVTQSEIASIYSF
jgi:hypothetical protein